MYEFQEGRDVMAWDPNSAMHAGLGPLLGYPWIACCPVAFGLKFRLN
jgi:hypothetical protein